MVSLEPNANADSGNGANQEIRILLGYHGALVRSALAEVLSGQDDLTVVGELARADDVPAVAPRARAHIAVLDIMLPGTVRVSELCTTLLECPVLVVLDRRSCARFGRSLAQLAPRVGLISTDATTAGLVRSVRRLVGGEAVLDPELALMVLRPAHPMLTERECEVLRCAANGMTAKEIATSMCLSAGTVRNYLSRILAKLGARTRIEAIRIAQDAGLI